MKKIGLTLFLHLQTLSLEPHLCSDIVEIAHFLISLWERL